MVMKYLISRMRIILKFHALLFTRSPRVSLEFLRVLNYMAYTLRPTSLQWCPNRIMGQIGRIFKDSPSLIQYRLPLRIWT